MKNELASLRLQRDQLLSVADASKARAAELENALAIKEKACIELKADLELTRQCRSEVDEAFERRYQVSSFVLSRHPSLAENEVVVRHRRFLCTGVNLN